MKRILCFCVIVLVGLCACASQNGARTAAWEKKIDARLRAALHHNTAQSQSPQNLQVLLKCPAPLSVSQKAKLAEWGVRVQTEAGTIVTATMPRAAVTEVAKLDYVIYLALSQESKSSSPEPQP